MAMSIKFGSSEVIKFIEIYRSHECLWDTNNENYKNRDVRRKALLSFAEELDINGFGVKEITTKIKNMRSQYLQEKKKIRTSMEIGSGAENVYHSKLEWFHLMDSFLATRAEPKSNSSNLDIIDDNVQILMESHPKNVTENSIEAEPRNWSTRRDKKVFKKRKATSDDSIEPAPDKLDSIAREVFIKEDEMDKFGNYVAACLRKLKTISSIKAQDDIQAVLSKYRLQDITAGIQ